MTDSEYIEYLEGLLIANLSGGASKEVCDFVDSLCAKQPPQKRWEDEQVGVDARGWPLNHPDPT